MPLLDLTTANPTQALLDYPHAEIAGAYATIPEFTYEPDACGLRLARDAVATYYSRRGMFVPADRIVLTASTSEAYALLFKLLCDPGDEVLVPVPSYPLFEYLAALESVRIVPYQLLYDGSWYIDLDHLKTQLSKRTRAIVCVNPNNPTGSYVKHPEADALFTIANDRKLPIISDEVFMDYGLSESTARVQTLAANDEALSVSLNGLSKSAGMPQMKLGWIVINGPEFQRTATRDRLELLLDTYLSVGTPVQRALPALLEIGERLQIALRDRAARNVAGARRILVGSSAHALAVEGGWSLILQLPNVISEENWIAGLLSEESVIVQPGYFFDMQAESHVVVSLITPPDQFDDGCSRLRRFVSRY